MRNKEIMEKLNNIEKYVDNISDIQNELIKTLGYTIMHYPPERNFSFKIEKINEVGDDS